MKSFSPEEELTTHRSEERLPEAEEALYEVLVPENEAKAIQMESFMDHYGETIIREDQKELARREATFTNDRSTKFGKLFEATVNHEIDESDLMGPNASVIVPSRYDDVVNKIDSIVEFEQDGSSSHLALAIDVTKSSKDLSKKFDGIRSHIEKGKLSRVKYFQSDAEDLKTFRGEMAGIPSVVVGADHKTVEDISNLILRSIRMRKNITESRRSGELSPATQNVIKEYSKVREALARHPLHKMVLIEITAQLQTFRNYARKHNKPQLVESYSQILRIIDGVMKEKEQQKGPTKEEDLSRDEIFSMIMDHVKLFV